MADSIHPFYALHRDAMEAAMRERLALAATLFSTRAQLLHVDAISQEIMQEFQTVLTQLPDVGGAENRMSDFFMRLIGFLAIGRVLRRHAVPLQVIGEIERDTYQAQLLAAPEAERLASGRQFLSLQNQAVLREQAASSATESHRQTFPADFAYEFVEPGPNDRFAFGINYTACGFCKFAARHGDEEILPSICGLDFVAYAARGIHLERTQTLAGGASHCNFRFSQLVPDEGTP